MKEVEATHGISGVLILVFAPFLVHVHMYMYVCTLFV